MFGIAFICLWLAIAVCCVVWARKAWRNPDNWYIHPDSKHLTFDRWPELALAGVLCLTSCLGLVAAFGF